MAELNPRDRVVDARIVYWGPAGSGKTTNLRAIHRKLRPDHRGELRRLATRLDPTIHYEVMPIELGDVGGFRTRIQVIGVPGDPDHGPSRKQLLDEVDGVVLVVDARRDQLDENVASFEELRSALAAYGRSLEDVPLVVQYNKCDLSDPYTLEELHRKLDVRDAAAFEAVASEGTAVLPTLTTISKRVMRALRERPPAPPPVAAPEPHREPEPEPEPATLEQALRVEATHPGSEGAAATARAAEALLETTLEAPSPADDALEAVEAAPLDVRLEGGLAVAELGAARRVSERAVEVALVLRDADGRSFPLTLTLSFGADDG